MFHLMLGLMAMGAVFAVIALALVPLWLGPLIQVFIAIFSKGKVARWIPGIFGLIGLAASLYFFCIAEHVLPIWGVLLYWAVYGLLLWAAHAIVCRIKEWLGSRQRR